MVFRFSACPAGTYTPNEGYAACLDCPAGYFCPNQTSNYAANTCPRGYYCPKGTKHDLQYACPPGTFNPSEATTNDTACLPCTPGSYCEGVGNTKPTNSCDPGYYCPGRIDNPRPAAYECRPGFYCPTGSPNMVTCTGGFYCKTFGLSSPTGLCDPGYYCYNGSSNANEKICPSGRYCEQGSDLPTHCPAGTFYSGTGATNESYCMNCTAGFYCNSTGLSETAGPCGEGYYCPEGQQEKYPAKYICPEGHYCKEGFAAPKRCENGTYQDSEGKPSCKQCLEGYYCDNTETAVDSLAGRLCPMGHYCPAGTRYSVEYPCLPGSWSNQTGLKKASDCDDCPQRYDVRRRYQEKDDDN